MVTSALHQRHVSKPCHVEGFRQCINDRDHFENDFLFLGMKFATKSILRPKWELTQNVKIKSAFSPKNNFQIPRLDLLHYLGLPSTWQSTSMKRKRLICSPDKYPCEQYQENLKHKGYLSANPQLNHGPVNLVG